MKMKMNMNMNMNMNFQTRFPRKGGKISYNYALRFLRGEGRAAPFFPLPLWAFQVPLRLPPIGLPQIEILKSLHR